MPVSERPEKSIFLSAIEIESPAERAAYLDRACAGNAELRREVEALLRSHKAPPQLLESQALTPPTIDSPPTAGRPGDVIGPYKLLQKMGEGGMGGVWMAEQIRTGPAPRRPQAHQGRAWIRAQVLRPVRSRAAGAGADGSPEHRQGARRRRDDRRAGRTS